jgi:plasmid stabilization system protein ParE
VVIEKLEFHDEAALEYDEAFNWYLERSPDAARKFDAEVERALTEILLSPRRWAAGPSETRRYLLRQFPFVLIYYEHSLNEIQIVAVAHTSRRPGYWSSRLIG